MLQLGHGDEAVETPVVEDQDANLVALLQLGHGDEAVETNHPVDDTGRESLLQLGHGDEAVETLPQNEGNRR